MADTERRIDALSVERVAAAPEALGLSATADYWEIYWDVTREVKVRFDREGISIPFPQRDVHLYESRETTSSS